MGLFELKLLLVIILCVPIALLGIKLASSLTDAALAGKKKGGKAAKRRRKSAGAKGSDGGG
ncbi:MAG: hypothetical protein LBS91_09005 [Clostridiales Family XIII bacterium]|jgi:hypothetical protein|nr:hypothetical protein [Clostridiales Family XIII bacterium]